MRIQNKDRSVQGVVFSKTFALLYFIIIVFFLYKIYFLFPIWEGHYEKNLEIKKEYFEKEIQLKSLKERKENDSTDLGKERYEKEFFNKLEPGEEMIVLYEGEADKTAKTENLATEEKPRHMFFWEKWYIDFLVWWKNFTFF
jgi:hypothetical protein